MCVWALVHRVSLCSPQAGEVMTWTCSDPEYSHPKLTNKGNEYEPVRGRIKWVVWAVLPLGDCCFRAFILSNNNSNHTGFTAVKHTHTV